MSLSALLVAAAVAAVPVENPPAAPSRGALTWVGVGLLGVSFAGVGLGIAGSLQNADAVRVLNAYPSPLPQEERGAYTELELRRDAGESLAIGGFVTAGIAFVGSVLCFILDAPPALKVAFAPSVGGGTFVFSARF